MSDSKMRILGIERDNKACNYYRIASPLEEIARQELAEVAFIEYGTEFDADENMDKVFASDIILLPRPSSEEWFGFVKACRRAGKLIVSDYDDDPFTCDPMNPYYRWIGVKEWSHPEFGDVWKDGMIDKKTGQEWFNVEKNINRRDMVRAAFKKSDLVTCTTEELAEVFLKINPNTVILPNSIDLGVYDRPEFVKRKVRIGWQGGVSHYRDLHFIKDVLKIIGKRNDVEIIYFGDSRFAHLLKDIDNLTMHPFVHHVSYPYRLALLNLDIGICPLIDNEFNRRKSAIKYFEYTAVGAATIATDMPPYNKVIRNHEDGVLVPNEVDAWVEELSALIESKKRILELSRNAYENVSTNHTIQKNAPLWIEAYKSAIQANMETVK